MVGAGLAARGDWDPGLLSLVRDGQTSAPAVSVAGRMTTVQAIASLGADVELDVASAFLGVC